MNFSFLYDGKKYFASDLQKQSTQTTQRGDVIITTDVYTLDAITVTRITKAYPNGAKYVLTYYENETERCSKILSDILDCDDETAICSPSPASGYTGYGKKGYVTLYDWRGSGIGADDFAEENTVLDNRPMHFLSRTGRSSETNMPFFNLDKEGEGYVYAIGWTGRWFSRFQKEEENAFTRTQIGVHNLNFYLKPHEKVRTTAVLKFPYTGGRREGYNSVKRFLKEYIVADRIKEKPLPFWISFWGGSTSKFMIARLNELQERKLDFDCFWIDAGWYGDYKEYCPSEFNPAWGNQVGNWFPNEMIHPNKLKDVSQKAHEIGYSFMLWFEPERADTRSYLFNEHRDWFLRRKESEFDALVDMGREEPRNYITKLVGDYIEELGIDLYRQDFNVDSIYYWEQTDAKDRQGITELKYVEGLYAFWDSLLARFPRLIIDNCASGGKRIDLETIARSVAFWRSDYQCLFDRDAEALQTHNTGISTFIPFSGSGVGQIMNDKYRRRSCYSATMGGNFIGYEFISIQSLDWDVKGAIDEFKSVREYFSCDFYPVFGNSTAHNCWGGWQFNRPEQKDGILVAFRRDECPLDRAVVELCGLDEEKTYEFYDVDEKTTSILNGKQLKENGFTIEIAQKRDSRLIKYRQI